MKEPRQVEELEKAAMIEDLLAQRDNEGGERISASCYVNPGLTAVHPRVEFRTFDAFGLRKRQSMSAFVLIPSVSHA